MNTGSIGAVVPRQGLPVGRAVSPSGGEGFARELRKAAGDLAASGLRFSSHAVDRMNRREIQLTAGLESRLNSGLQSLASKGSKDGLVVADDNRFVVSVNNRTVITAMTSRDRDVYTNIDGVVFV